MNTKLVFAVIAVLAIALGLYFFSSPQATAPTPDELNNDTQENMQEEPSDATTTAEEERSETPEPAPPKTSTAPAQGSYSAPAPQPDPEPQLPYNRIVTYDGNRFMPEEVTVVEGGTVRFVNLSDDEKMWVASDNHPTHKRYPLKSDDNCIGSDFDQCEAVEKGGSWSFTFERFGIWGYHNHERAKDTGEVEVMRIEDYLDTL